MHKLQRDATIKSSRRHDSNNYALGGARSRDKKGTLTSADPDFISLSFVRAIMPLLYVRTCTSADLHARVVLSDLSKSTRNIVMITASYAERSRGLVVLT